MASTAFGDLLATSLSAVTSTLDASEAAALLAQVAAVQKLNAAATLADLEAAYKSGWLPDYYAAAELTLTAQYALASEKDTTIQGQAGVGGSVGPVAINVSGSLAQTTRQGSNSNLGVSITLQRQSRSAAIENGFNGLSVTTITPPAPNASTDPANTPAKGV